MGHATTHVTHVPSQMLLAIGFDWQQLFIISSTVWNFVSANVPSINGASLGDNSGISLPGGFLSFVVYVPGRTNAVYILHRLRWTLDVSLLYEMIAWWSVRASWSWCYSVVSWSFWWTAKHSIRRSLEKLRVKCLAELSYLLAISLMFRSSSISGSYTKD